MRIRLTKPLVQSGRVIPPGVILSSAPPVFMRKLVTEGRAELIDDVFPPDGLSAAIVIEDILEPTQPVQAAPAPVATAAKETKPPRASRRKVMPHG